jgi:hypothetical protein
MHGTRAVRTVGLVVVVFSFHGCNSVPTRPALVTYVDATDGPAGNTQYATGEVLTAKGSPLIGNDDLWSKRPEGNGGSVFTTNDGRPSGPEDGPQLVTKVSGLAPGTTYRVYAYFWTDQNNWQLKAALSPISLPGDDPRISFSKNGTPIGQTARTADAADFAGPVIVTESNRQLLRADLGQTVADANGDIRVWIDDFPNAGHSNRTWYDGVGVLPLPPPAMTNFSLMMALVIAAIAAAILYVAASLIRNRRLLNDAESPVIPT